MSTKLAAAVLAASAAQAATPASIPHQEFVCMRGTEQRIIALYNQLNEHSSTGCRVEYTKAGRTQVLWTSQVTRGYCTGKATQLVTQLSQDSFQCTPRTIEAAEDGRP
jgi:hypothetical protein